MGGHDKCLLLMTRGGQKNPKTCLRNTWMFPNQTANPIDKMDNPHCLWDKPLGR